MKSKSTKKALTTSIISILLCLAMFVGTTFAWFTDTASTTVNTIQAGTLDVALEMNTGTADEPNWVSAEGKTLEFKKASTASGEEVLWEPGCTYELPELRVVNNGNLALKYKVIISGIKGSAKLNEAIEWTMELDGADYVVDAEHNLAAKTDTVTDSDIFTISGHMTDEAGNDYQGLSIEGIAITVVATQDTVEYDSNSQTYDEYAKYPVVAVTQVAVNNEKTTTAQTTINSVETISQENNTSLAVATIPAGVKTTATDGEESIQLKLTIDEASVPANFTAVVDDAEVAKTLEVNMEGLATDNNVAIKVEMYVGTGMEGFKLYHNNNEMTAADSVNEVDADQEYYYNSESGIVTMITKSFSPFTYIYDTTINVASMNDLSVASSADWARIVKPGYYKLTDDITIDSKTLCFNAGGVDINLNGKTLIIDGKQFRTNAEVVDAKFYNGTIEIKGSGNLWMSSWGTTNLTFDDVDVKSSQKTIFYARSASKDCTLNIVGSDFNIENSKFLWANPDEGSENVPSKVNVSASGVSVKQTNYTYLEAVNLQTQYTYGEVVATFENCYFDSSIRDCEPVKISSYASNTGNSISLTMTKCSLIAKEGTNYISGSDASNVTLVLNNCTGNYGTSLTN